MFEVVDMHKRKINTLPCVLPARVVHGSNRVVAICEHVFRMFATDFFDYLHCDPVKYQQTFFTIFHPDFRDDIYAGTQLGNEYFPFPAQITHFLFPSGWVTYDKNPVALQQNGFTLKQINAPEAVLRVSQEG